MIFRSGLRVRISRSKCRPVHLRHHHVGDDQIDLAALLVERLDRLDAVATPPITV